MTDNEIINNEKYHTCGRCKYENTPDDKYPCVSCIHGTDHRTDLWELEQESDESVNVERGKLMTFEEAKKIFLNRGYIEVPGGTYYDADKWRESISVISKWLEQEKTGKWEITTTIFCGRTFEVIQCSCCKEKQDWYKKTNFCPNCGARMVD